MHQKSCVQLSNEIGKRFILFPNHHIFYNNFSQNIYCPAPVTKKRAAHASENSPEFSSINPLLFSRWCIYQPLTWKLLETSIKTPSYLSQKRKKAPVLYSPHTPINPIIICRAQNSSTSRLLSLFHSCSRASCCVGQGSRSVYTLARLRHRVYSL